MWHSDGPHLNKDFERRHLPPHAVNVFVPLVDVTLSHGPTEFVPGSHCDWHVPCKFLILLIVCCFI